MCAQLTLSQIHSLDKCSLFVEMPGTVPTLKAEPCAERAEFPALQGQTSDQGDSNALGRTSQNSEVIHKEMMTKPNSRTYGKASQEGREFQQR